MEMRTEISVFLIPSAFVPFISSLTCCPRLSTPTISSLGYSNVLSFASLLGGFAECDGGSQISASIALFFCNSCNVVDCSLQGTAPTVLHQDQLLPKISCVKPPCYNRSTPLPQHSNLICAFFLGTITSSRFVSAHFTQNANLCLTCASNMFANCFRVTEIHNICLSCWLLQNTSNSCLVGWLHKHGKHGKQCANQQDVFQKFKPERGHTLGSNLVCGSFV